MDTVIIAEEIIIKVRFENRETSNAPINEAILSNYKNQWSFILYYYCHIYVCLYCLPNIRMHPTVIAA